MKNLIALVSTAAAMIAAAEVAPYGVYEDGMLVKTEPRGWLRAACETQRTGLTGHPEALSYPYNTCLWDGQISRMGNHGCGWWRYEQTGYYTDGLLTLGYALKDDAMIAKGEAGVDYTLEHATAEGQLGDPCLWDDKNFKLSSGFELWPHAVFFRVMKQKYDATKDERIPKALEKFYLLKSPELVAKERNMVNTEAILWTYSKTGNRALVELVEKAWALRGTTDGWSGDLAASNCANDEPIYMHGVSYSEELKIPLLLAAYTGKREYLDQAINVERKLVRDHMLPDGCPSSTEQTRGNTVHWGHETCVVSDYTWSLGYYLETTGVAEYADKIERCVFNAGFGAIANDWKSLQYFSNVNQFIATSESNHNPFFYGSTWMQFRPTHETECCAGNMHRFLPNYVSRMWMKDRKGNPVVALYGPSEVDYGFAKITEETDYPYDGKVKFTFAMKSPKTFVFTYRVPGWCTARADRGTFVKVEREFKDGDSIELDFPMETTVEELPRRYYVIKDAVSHWSGKIPGRETSQGSVVRRGPLMYACPIAAEKTEDIEEHANMRGKKSGNPDFKSWNLRPKSPFNYALVKGAAPVFKDGKVTVKAKRIKWELDNGRYTPDIPERPEVLDGEIVDLELVPYGATELRLAAFPTVE